MKNILNSIFDSSMQDHLILLEDVLTIQLSELEAQYIDYLIKSFDGVGRFPTKIIFLSKFPECEQMLSKAQYYNGKDLKFYVDEFIEKRRAKQISSEIMDIASKVIDEGLDEEDILKLQSKIKDKNKQVEEDNYSLTSFNELYQRNKIKKVGLSTGVNYVDDIIGGLDKGTVNTIMAYTSQGKSMLATNIAYKNSYEKDYNICIISLEVSKEEIKYNLLTRHSNLSKFDKYPFISKDKIKFATLDEKEEDYLMNVIIKDYEENKQGLLIILDEDDFANFSYSEIRKKLYHVDDICKEKTGHGLDALIVDHIGLMKFTDNSNSNNKSEYSIINDYTSFFRRLTLSFRKYDDGSCSQLTTILLAQANRKGFEDATKKKGNYSLTAIAEANEIERSSYRIFSIWTNDELKFAKECIMCILKNRGGQTVQDGFSVTFDGERYLVGDLNESNNSSSLMDFMKSNDSSSMDFDNLFNDDDFNIGW